MREFSSNKIFWDICLVIYWDVHLVNSRAYKLSWIFVQTNFTLFAHHRLISFYTLQSLTIVKPIYHMLTTLDQFDIIVTNFGLFLPKVDFFLNFLLQI